ncbi:heparan-sulfate 6-O-sulfotransferase 1-A-like [Diadema setosum]|uniref:heparan-sulfate 6-O-sulfotransferase 1-A-like n=1 Tax=Diadema setosum TaxID=31175 RepID=UPI003B3B8927
MPPFHALLRKWRYGLLLTLILTLGFVLYSCSMEGGRYAPIADNRHSAPYIPAGDISSYVGRHRFPESSLDRRLDFNINGNDVMVFLHMQKTGGTTFGKHLTRDLDLSSPCECSKSKKRCNCYRPSSRHQFWLFSRLSTGWMCGLHADWTELHACVPDAMDRKEKIKVRRRYFYITVVRNPVNRYISEWRHTQRGATWKSSRLMCGGREATEKEIPPCFTSTTWMGVTLKDFMACPSNLAHNRQTRMLADLTLVGCYNHSGLSTAEYERILLASAKANLESMAFFGLTDHQRELQYLFERTFRMSFRADLMQHNLTIANASPVQDGELELVKAKNHLDMELYAFAKDLFFQRYKHMKDLERKEAQKTNSPIS